MRRFLLPRARALCALFSLSSAVAGCPSDPEPQPREGLDFPEGFLFGTAIAGFQVDMGCPTLPADDCEDPNSDWYQFVTSPDTVGSGAASLSGDPPSQGPGHWELWDSDLDLAAGDLSAGSHRFSIEWSRVFPNSTEGIDGYDALRAVANPDALLWYHAYLDGVRARGMEPLVTLNHYTLPTWIHDGVGCHVDLDNCSPRGWLDSARTVAEISKYAGFVAQEFGAQVDLWATENEPLAIVLPGYLMPSAERSNPPAATLASQEAKLVMATLIEGHARMYDAVVSADTADADGDGEPAEVGLVYAMAPIDPQDASNPEDLAATENVYYLWNTAFLDAVVRGDFDGDLDGTAEHREDLASRMDWLGINYYARGLVDGTESAMLDTFSPLTTFNPFNLVFDWDYDRGMERVVRAAWERYGIPLRITENGAQDPTDSVGSDYLVRHLSRLHAAIEAGADVRGYHWWTLMDNYEWNHGMGEVRMGLFAMDESDPEKARVARASAATFAEIAREGGIPAAMLEQYPVIEE